MKGYEGDALWFNFTEDEDKDNLKKDRLPKRRRICKVQTGSVTQQYKDIPSIGTKVSQRNEYM